MTCINIVTLLLGNDHYCDCNGREYSNDEHSNQLNVGAQDAAKGDICQPLAFHIVPGVVCIASLQF